MNREEAIEYVGHVVDDALCARRLGADPYATVREAGDTFKHASRLVGWQCGFEPMFVAVHSYLDVRITDDEAVELATDYLEEIGWFSDGPTDNDYLF